MYTIPSPQMMNLKPTTIRRQKRTRRTFFRRGASSPSAIQRRATHVDGSPKIGQSKSIVTTIDQARWRGNITIGVQRTSPSEVIEHELIVFGKGTCQRDLEVEAGALVWVHQGAVGYVVQAPETESLNISIRCGTAITATDPDEAAKSKWGSDLPFLVLIDHGVNPSNSSYVYAVVPGVNASDLQGSILAEVRKALSPTSILRNDANVQAFVGGSSGGGGRNASVVQVVFRSSTEAQLPLGRGGSLVAVTSNRPAVAMFMLSSSHWNLSVAEATRDGAAKTLQVSIKDNPLLVSGRYNYRLPGIEPMDAVDDVVVSSSTSGSTDIVIGLPDMADDEAYGHRAEMFLSAPINVQIPRNVTLSEASSTTPAGIAYTLEPTRNFAPHAACAETRTWQAHLVTSQHLCNPLYSEC